ncbi:MAG: hypothetical protein H6Q89_5502 [Myxococcaceae bacterium]|nr:hypothetical protein [Myxococcaceae bacterium]
MVHLFFMALALSQPNVDALKREARALCKPAGCTEVAQCKVLPLGSKPCGGPTEFLVCCAKSTDLPALEAKAKQASEAEQAKNAAGQVMGICTALAPPKVKLENGQCAAVEPKSADFPM